MPDFKDYNHILIQLKEKLIMKQFIVAIAACALLFACTPGDKNNGDGGGNQNNQDELTVTGTASDITEYSATLTGYANLPFELGDAEVGIMYDTKQSFEGGQKVAATALDGNNKFTVTVTGLAPGTTYYYKSYVQNGMAVKYGAVLSFTTKESTVPAGAVDLGIVMTRADGTTYNLYWAKSNLSVNGLCPNPEDYGDYYAWGETEPYYSSHNPLTWKDGKSAGYNWASYKWSNGNYNKLTRYCPEDKAGYWDGTGTPDNKTEFADYNYADDAARARLGGKWRMPTDAEWTALRNNCTWTWTTQNGVNGILVTAPNGNSIFLPAAGYRVVTYLDDAGSLGDYWSSSLNSDSPYYAWSVVFYSDDVYRSSYCRYGGRSVRPVTE